jgi:hypothetical protein
VDLAVYLVDGLHLIHRKDKADVMIVVSRTSECVGIDAEQMAALVEIDRRRRCDAFDLDVRPGLEVRKEIYIARPGGTILRSGRQPAEQSDQDD